MSRKFTVMGFTEAELGFILAAFFAALGVGYQQESAKALEKASAAAAKLHAEIARGDSARAQLDTLRRRHEYLLDSIGRKSNLTPRCAEKGEPDVPVAQITVLAADLYLTGGAEMTFADLKQRLSVQIRRQRELGCLYSVQILAVRGVDATAFSAATRQVRSVFYADLR